MAYNEKLAERIREIFVSRNKVEEKKMMGGLTYMVNGKMCVGILKDDLMVRLDPDVYGAALKKEGCREMNFTGRPMKGFVFVNPKGTGNKKDLSYWINLALDFNKKAKASRKESKMGHKKR
jgi:TfoX/Sxy family transcriptional regulator of competence genes